MNTDFATPRAAIEEKMAFLKKHLAGE
jgi:hypothetical protein